MLKFIKHHMESIVGIELYPIISLLIFFIFFTVLLIVVVKTKKERINLLAAMPLDEDDTPLRPGAQTRMEIVAGVLDEAVKGNFLSEEIVNPSKETKKS